MTLIITAINKSNVVQASDRRLTRDGKLEDDNANKAICVMCRDARFGIAYTGLAELKVLGKIRRTDEIVADYLAKIDAGNKNLHDITSLLAGYIQPIINSQQTRSNNDKRTTFALAGFYKDRLFVGGVSNFEDKDGKCIPVKNSFSIWLKTLSPTDENPCLFMVNGIEEVVDDTFWPQVVKSGKKIAYQSNDKLSKKLVLLIRWAAHHPTLGIYIGQNCMSTAISPDGNFVTNYHSLRTSPKSYAPHLIQPGLAFKNIETWTGSTPSWWKS